LAEDVTDTITAIPSLPFGIGLANNLIVLPTMGVSDDVATGVASDDILIHATLGPAFVTETVGEYAVVLSNVPGTDVFVAPVAIVTVLPVKLATTFA